MKNRTRAAWSTPHLSQADAAAQRAANIAKITDLLAAGPKSAVDLTVATGINRSTIGTLLLHMERDLRTSRRNGERRGSQVLWELGENPSLDLEGEDEDLQAIAPKRPVAPAEQVGMWRDGLVAALFGAPQGVAA